MIYGLSWSDITEKGAKQLQEVLRSNGLAVSVNQGKPITSMIMQFGAKMERAVAMKASSSHMAGMFCRSIFCIALASTCGRLWSQDPPVSLVDGSPGVREISPPSIPIDRLVERAALNESFDRGTISEWQLQRWCWVNGMSIEASEKLFLSRLSKRLSLDCPSWWASNLMIDWKELDELPAKLHDDTMRHSPVVFKPRKIESNIDSQADHFVGKDQVTTCVLTSRQEGPRRRMKLHILRENLPENEINIVDLAPILGGESNGKIFADVFVKKDECTLFVQEGHFFWTLRIDIAKKSPLALFFNQTFASDSTLCITFEELRKVRPWE